MREETDERPSAFASVGLGRERILFGNLLVRIHFIIVMMRRTGLAP